MVIILSSEKCQADGGEARGNYCEPFFGWKIADGYSEMTYDNVEKLADVANVKLYKFHDSVLRTCLSM